MKSILAAVGLLALLFLGTCSMVVTSAVSTPPRQSNSVSSGKVEIDIGRNARETIKEVQRDWNEAQKERDAARRLHCWQQGQRYCY